MAARSMLVLTDRAGTPVTHNYTPDGDDVNGVHLFSEKTGVPAGDPRFSARLLKSKGGQYRPTLRLTVPIVQTQIINGVSSPVVVRTAYAEVTFTFDALSSAQERADVVGLMASALPAAQTQINDLIVNLSDIY